MPSRPWGSRASSGSLSERRCASRVASASWKSRENQGKVGKISNNPLPFLPVLSAFFRRAVQSRLARRQALRGPQGRRLDRLLPREPNGGQQAHGRPLHQRQGGTLIRAALRGRLPGA